MLCCAVRNPTKRKRSLNLPQRTPAYPCIRMPTLMRAPHGPASRAMSPSSASRQQHQQQRRTLGDVFEEYKCTLAARALQEEADTKYHQKMNAIAQPLYELLFEKIVGSPPPFFASQIFAVEGSDDWVEGKEEHRVLTPAALQKRLFAYVATAAAKKLPVVVFACDHADIAKEAMNVLGLSKIHELVQENQKVISRHWPFTCTEERLLTPSSEHWKDHGGMEICCGCGDDCYDVDDAQRCYWPFTYGEDSHPLFSEGSGGYMDGASCYGDCCMYATARTRILLTYSRCRFPLCGSAEKSFMFDTEITEKTAKETEKTAKETEKAVKAVIEGPMLELVASRLHEFAF